jgi:hypothetical protein
VFSAARDVGDQAKVRKMQNQNAKERPREKERTINIGENRTWSALPVPLPFRLHGWRLSADKHQRTLQHFMYTSEPRDGLVQIWVCCLFKVEVNSMVRHSTCPSICVLVGPCKKCAFPSGCAQCRNINVSNLCGDDTRSV